MTIDKLVQRFWNHSGFGALGTSSVSMYFYLLWQLKNNQLKEFSVADTQISRDLGISRNTVRICREKLKRVGLLYFEIPRGGSVQYNFEKTYDSKNCVSKSEDLQKDKIILKKQKINKLVKTELANSEITPTITEIQKLNSEISSPSFDEFLSFAKTLEFYQENMQNALEEKYRNWLENGWKNALGKPITNWKLSVKNLIPYLQNAPSNSISLQKVPNITRPKE